MILEGKTMEKLNWEKLVNSYLKVKEYYILCEETDPELKTNLQPLNEFRAALDHLMRIVAIEHTAIKENGVNSELEYNKLLGHLKRAYYDICDMLSINYRNKIIDTLEIYEPEVIGKAIPNYYSKIRPQIELNSEKIAELREEKGFGNEGAEIRMNEYQEIITDLREYYDIIQVALPSLEELRKKSISEKRKNIVSKYVIPIASVVVSAIIAITGMLV